MVPLLPCESLQPSYPCFFLRLHVFIAMGLFLHRYSGFALWMLIPVTTQLQFSHARDRKRVYFKTRFSLFGLPPCDGGKLNF